jgi:hypothetical protein
MRDVIDSEDCLGGLNLGPLTFRGCEPSYDGHCPMFVQGVHDQGQVLDPNGNKYPGCTFSMSADGSSQAGDLVRACVQARTQYGVQLTGQAASCWSRLRTAPGHGLTMCHSWGTVFCAANGGDVYFGGLCPAGAICAHNAVQYSNGITGSDPVPQAIFGCFAGLGGMNQEYLTQLGLGWAYHLNVAQTIVPTIHPTIDIGAHDFRNYYDWWIHTNSGNRQFGWNEISNWAQPDVSLPPLPVPTRYDLDHEIASLQFAPNICPGLQPMPFSSCTTENGPSACSCFDNNRQAFATNQFWGSVPCAELASQTGTYGYYHDQLQNSLADSVQQLQACQTNPPTAPPVGP